MLHVPCAVQTQQIPATGDIFDDSFPSRECGRMVRTDRGCLPTYLRLLEPEAWKVYQLPSVRRLDQPATCCQWSWNPDYAVTGLVENAYQPHEENGLDIHLLGRVYVSTRTRTLTPSIKRLINPSSGIVGACIRLALYLHRLYVQKPGSSQSTSKYSPPLPRESLLRREFPKKDQHLTAISGARRINCWRCHCLLRRARHVPHRRLPAPSTTSHRPSSRYS